MQGGKRNREQQRSPEPKAKRQPGARAKEAALGKPTQQSGRRPGPVKESVEACAAIKMPPEVQGLRREEGFLKFNALAVHRRELALGRGGRR